MARSLEATRRRAERRSRTVEEQRKADGEAQKKQSERERDEDEQRQRFTSSAAAAAGGNDDDAAGGTSTAPDNPMTEPRAWICPACGNHNFASRRSCHSITCNERQPTDGANRPNKRARHDRTASKTSTWSAAQADPSTIEDNRKLRQRFMETKGEGMDEKERERAQTLIARDARKREKKLQQKGKQVITDDKATTCKQDKDCTNPTPVKVADKEIRKRNKALRKRYLKTNGDGMTHEEQERARMLIARDERKRQKRAQNEPEAKRGASA